MEIYSDKLQGLNAVKIRSTKGNGSVYIILEEKELKNPDKLSEVAIVTLGHHKHRTTRTSAEGMLITSRGEYEVNEISISAQINRQSKDSDDNEEFESLDMLEIDVDGVRVMYYGSTLPINKNTLDQFGAIDILIINVGENFDNQTAAIKTIDPQIVIPITSNPNANLEKFRGDVGASFVEMEKAKFRAEDFANEEYIMHGVTIS